MRSRFLLLVSVASVAALGAACATGSTFNGGLGGLATGGSSSTGGAGGRASSSTSSSGHTSTSSGASSSGHSSSTSSSGGTCSESPCNPVSPQCGCPTGEACTITGNALGCGIAGSTTPGSGCQTADECEAASICVGSICDLFCASDGDCSGGTICAIQLSNGSGGAIAGVTLCTNSCDLSTNAGCPSGTACQLGQEATGSMRYYTYCDTAGTLTAGATCDNTTTFCAPTYGCFNTGSGMSCAQYCYVGASNACSGCSALTNSVTSMKITVNGRTVGACP